VNWLGTNVIRSDGRAVTSDAHLWAVPAGVVARTPNARTSENLKVPKTLFASRPDCVEGAICNERDDCYEYNCLRCVPAGSTPGECLPQGGCPSIPSPNGQCTNVTSGVETIRRTAIDNVLRLGKIPGLNTAWTKARRFS